MTTTPGPTALDPRRIRVLVAKVGLDGHDVGAKLICRALMAAGMEVIYTGLRQSPQAIASAVGQEAVDVLGLSILSGAHLPLCRKVREELDRRGARQGLLWIVGGNVPRRDHAQLAELGVAEVFPTGTAFATVVSFLEKKVRR